MKNLLDLHTHTIASGHAYTTLLENVAAAKRNGLVILGVSDHAPEMPGGAHKFYFHNLKVLPDSIDGIRILKGAELNILNQEGEVDLGGRAVDVLDYAIASLHVPCIENLGIEGNTQALIRAMDHKLVKIIGHPDDSRYPVDYEALVQVAVEKRVLLEVNNSSLMPYATREGARENYRDMLRLCEKYNAPVIIGSDAHYCDHVGGMDQALELMEEIGFPKALVVNFNADLFWTYIS
ncbi:phosphatase [Fusibacter tunisiensis]|uniref:Hydrolase n=1 Tax=Fusibacter tunisiensis TaxID=1008308 RepID=A0ABS2MTH8_9FIRM|nr:phosphatase [Fusibacter tunisiensis]MBM7562677.1 putative hydrolase [Fusibacter tunisiensis]